MICIFSLITIYEHYHLITNVRNQMDISFILDVDHVYHDLILYFMCIMQLAFHFTCFKKKQAS